MSHYIILINNQRTNKMLDNFGFLGDSPAGEPAEKRDLLKIFLLVREVSSFADYQLVEYAAPFMR